MMKGGANGQKVRGRKRSTRGRLRSTKGKDERRGAGGKRVGWISRGRGHGARGGWMKQEGRGYRINFRRKRVRVRKLAVEGGGGGKRDGGG